MDKEEDMLESALWYPLETNTETGMCESAILHSLRTQNKNIRRKRYTWVFHIIFSTDLERQQKKQAHPSLGPDRYLFERERASAQDDTWRACSFDYPSLLDTYWLSLSLSKAKKINKRF